MVKLEQIGRWLSLDAAAESAEFPAKLSNMLPTFAAVGGDPGDDSTHSAASNNTGRYGKYGEWIWVIGIHFILGAIGGAIGSLLVLFGGDLLRWALDRWFSRDKGIHKVPRH